MKEKQTEGLESFLVDAEEVSQEDIENNKYIQPDIELKLPAHKRKECREIVQEIKRFGVTGQRQLLYLIYLLSLEVENHETMTALVKACKQGRKELPEERKLIIPK